MVLGHPIISLIMAVPAGQMGPKERQSRPLVRPDVPGNFHQAALTPPQVVQEAASLPVSDLQLTAATLYGKGYTRPQVIRILVDHLAPRRVGETAKRQHARARGKLRRWERTDQFRDLVYQNSLVEMDMQIPGILNGIAKKARHRVDAARLILEVTGRHNPKGEMAPPNITVQIANIPRPD